MLVNFYQTTWSNNPEDRNLHTAKINLSWYIIKKCGQGTDTRLGKRVVDHPELRE
jgi:hypothetical protein